MEWVPVGAIGAHQAAPTYPKRTSIPPPLYQVIVPKSSKGELLKLPSGVPHGFFSTEILKQRGEAAPPTQY